MSVSVGDFAENLLAGGSVEAPALAGSPLQADPSLYSRDVTAQAPDISKVMVPSEFVQSLVEEKTPVIPVMEEEVFSPPSTPELTTSQPITEVTELRSLIKELKDILAEVKSTLVEMTTVGMMGVNMAGPTADKKKKDCDGVDSMEDLLKKIRKRRRKV